MAEDEQGVPQGLVARVDAVFEQSLPGVLAEVSPADGARLAAAMSEQIWPLLVPTREWLRRPE